jgi:predicted dehydrogenase
VIWDLAPHDVSILNYLLHSEPVSVHAIATAHARRGVEDVAYLQLVYPAGGRSGGNATVSAHVHVSWLDPCKVRRVTVVGSQQMAVYNDLADEGRIRIYDKGIHHRLDSQELHESPVSYRYGSIVSPYINFQEPLQVMDRHFLQCVIDGERPQTDGTSGLSVVRTLVAAERSVREHRTVHLEEMLTVNA